MKQSMLSLLLAAMCVLAVDAGTRSAQQALAVARQFATTTVTPVATADDAQLVLAHEARALDGNTDYYVFNRGATNGYIVVAGDDHVPAVLGWADAGTFCYDSLPDNARWWLGELQREVAYARSIGAAPRNMPMLNTSVKPLVKTRWDQGAPYNNLCPTYNGGSTHAVTGCVATAVAQIMNVHKWPTVGTGSITYQCRVNGEPATTLSADFSQIHFDWNNMRDNYGFGRSTEVQKTAVAELMSAVGIATEMMYGSSSGTFSIKAFDALRDFFGYDASMRFVLRDFYPLDEWEQMLRDELDAGRPIYYAGESNGGGHAFVFDGYNNSGYFHVNWGWGGRSDAYFLVTALNPQSMGGGDGFNSGQEAILNIMPDQGGTPVTQPITGYLADFGTKVHVADLGSEVPLSMINFTFLGDEPIDSVTFAVEVLDMHGVEQVAVLPLVTDEVLKGYTYFFSDDEPIAMTLPATLPDGEYRLVAAYSFDRLATVAPFVRKADSAGYVTMTVADGVAHFSDDVPPQGEMLLMSPITPLAESMPADEVKAEVLVKAQGGFCEGDLTMQVMRRDAYGAMQTIATTSSHVDIRHTGQQKVVNFQVAIEAEEGDTCYLALEGSETSEPAMFVIGDWPIPEAVMLEPIDECELNFGYIVTNKTYIETLPVQGENMRGSLTLTITGRDAARFSVTPSTLSQGVVNRGTTVNVKYRAMSLGNHDAQLVISGGGLAEPVIVNLVGASYYIGDINRDDKVDVDDVNALVNILTKHAPNEWPRLNDIDGNMVVDIDDVNCLLNMLLSL